MPAPRKYSDDMKARAVRLVRQMRAETGLRRGPITRVADQLGINAETLRSWVNQDEVDQRQRAGVTTEQQRRLVELERENRELRRANEILKSASAFFAAELDRPQR